MIDDNMTCPDDDALAALLEQTVDSDDRRALLEHLDVCAACRALVADVVGLTADRQAPAELGRGDAIGRYVIDRVRGAGAMGVVYAAHDPRLARDVALKVLRAGPTDRDALLREARTIARLSHPNVVAIHDVIAEGDELAIAMELVSGSTLASWLAARPRSWSQIRDVMLQAGRGLAAAHAAGIVHRDIKPDNILVASDGRARVTDFGLANLGDNVVAGTPAYMAPELLAGGAIDARSDVYSFCVVLHEALYGARPGERPAQRRFVPARVRRALERGLATDPAQRSLEDVLAALAARDRTAVVIAVAAVLVAAPAVALALRQAGPPACSGGAAAWGEPWNGGAIAEAFTRTGLASAPSAFARADASMSDYRRRWIDVHRSVCLATERGEQSSDLLDRRMRCLENRRKDAAALASLLTTADRSTADRAAELVLQLSPPSECTSTAIVDLAARPTAAADRAALEAIETRASQARAQQEAGRAAVCLETVAATLPDARRLGYAPVIAGLLYTRARCESSEAQIVDDLHATAAAAALGRDDDTLARAWIRLIYMEAFVEHHYDEAARWEQYAHAIVERLGRPTQLELSYLMNTGLARLAARRMDEARALIEQRRAIILATKGAVAPELAEIEESLGGTYLDEWRFAEAYEHYRRAEALIAPGASPINARLWLLQNESVALRGLGRPRDALSLFPTIFALMTEHDPAGDDSWARSLYGDRAMTRGHGRSTATPCAIPATRPARSTSTAEPARRASDSQGRTLGAARRPTRVKGATSSRSRGPMRRSPRSSMPSSSTAPTLLRIYHSRSRSRSRLAIRRAPASSPSRLGRRSASSSTPTTPTAARSPRSTPGSRLASVRIFVRASQLEPTGPLSRSGGFVENAARCPSPPPSSSCAKPTS